MPSEVAEGNYKPEWKNPSFELQEPYSVKYKDSNVPEISDPHDVIVKVEFTGICGSDVHYWTDGRIGSFIVKEPMVLGHESSGIIHSLGSSVTTLQKGDRVAMEPGVPCRRCSACKHGKYNLCAEMSFAATPPIHGTLCRYYRIPEDFCYKLPDHVALEEGALVEPLSVAVHVVKQSGVKPGDKVVVFGCGPVGLLCCAVAKAFSAAGNEGSGGPTVVAVDVNESRVKFAKEYAANMGFVPAKGEGPDEIARRICEECGFTDQLGADVAIDATGAEICMQTGLHVLKSGGTFVQAGMGKPDVTFPVLVMVGKELNVKGSFRYGPGDYELAVDLLSSGKVDVTQMISKKVPFDKAEEAFHDTKAAKAIKILIEGPKG